MIAEGFADSTYYCFSFGLEFYNFYYALYQSMGYNFNTFLISFLFTQMGNAIEYKSAFERIKLNQKNQAYDLAMF
jgi:hypothetical protein